MMFTYCYILGIIAMLIIRTPYHNQNKKIRS
jgi:hypothetical protein